MTWTTIESLWLGIASFCVVNLKVGRFLASIPQLGHYVQSNYKVWSMLYASAVNGYIGEHVK